MVHKYGEKSGWLSSQLQYICIAMFRFWIIEDGGLLLGPLPTAIPDQLVFHKNFGFNTQYHITALHLEQLFEMKVR